MSQIAPTTIRLSDEDKVLIAALKQRYGVQSTTQLIRLALRLMGDRENRNVAMSVAEEKTN